MALSEQIFERYVKFWKGVALEPDDTAAFIIREGFNDTREPAATEVRLGRVWTQLFSGLHAGVFWPEHISDIADSMKDLIVEWFFDFLP